ncbi:DNA cytosine methyltransferase [Vibrio sp. SCSIO 43140]|uniref:DNA cytosine methyltransferase n=1 Tax=Vibrio sp. SCSIO 43140 TaxID=2819100 RepID=UPI002075696B|nr:DNA cytosine methyltransferase [Vibrio sp. SCSIO 43140]USD59039.1 DNA cytosine methyltransferase [Vibrio sp. SCSIO 43140]
MFERNSLVSLNDDEITADFFAGGGGASTGMEEAFGVPVTIAVNHCAVAISMHRANHPHTKHYNSNIWDVDPTKAVRDAGGKRIGLAWWSPSCTHFSIARAGVPVERNIRGQAWVALKWSLQVPIRVHAIENVREFSSWSPLKENEHGQMFPDPERRGETFRDYIKAFTTGLKPTDPSWQEAIRFCGIEFDVKQKLRLYRGLGYKAEVRELEAHRYGAATTRRRLFVVMRNDGEPIRWPAPTHGNSESLPEYQPIKVANDVTDWSLATTSIFARPRELAPKTMLRLARGFDRFVIHNELPDVVPPQRAPQMIQNKTAQRPDRPISGSQAFLKTFFSGCDSVIDTTISPTPLNSLDVKPVESELHCFSFYTKMRGSNIGFATRSPIHTISANGNHMGLVTVWLRKIGSLVAPEKHNEIEFKLYLGNLVLSRSGNLYELVDVGLRMMKPAEMYAAHGFPSTYQFKSDDSGKPLTQSQQVHKLGNSVCPPLVRALITANFSDYPESDALVA